MGREGEGSMGRLTHLMGNGIWGGVPRTNQSLKGRGPLAEPVQTQSGIKRWRSAEHSRQEPGRRPLQPSSPYHTWGHFPHHY